MALLLQTVFSGLVNGSVYGLIGLGLVLCYRSARVVNLAQGETFTAAGLIAAETAGLLPAWVAVLLALAAATALGAALERLVLRPRLAWPLDRLIILVVAVALCLEGIYYLAVGPDQYSFAAITGGGAIHVGGALLTDGDIAVIAALVVIAAFSSWFLHRTVIGQGMSACAENPMAASLLGVNVPAMRLVAFGAAGLVGGIAAILAVPLSSVTYGTGLSLTLLGYVAAALARMKSPLGSCVAGLAIGVGESLLGTYVNQLLAEPLALGVLMVAAVALLGRQIRFGGVERA